MPGWQVYFVSNDNVIGCMGKSGLMTRRLSDVGTFNCNRKYAEKQALALLSGPNPLDGYYQLTYSIKWKD